MRVFSGSHRQTIRALWRGVLLCLVLVAFAAHAERSFGPRFGLEAPHLHITQALTASHESHPEACQGLGHCAPAFAILPLALNIAQVSEGRIAFVWPNATTALGRSVDPGQHPPKALQAV